MQACTRMPNKPTSLSLVHLILFLFHLVILRMCVAVTVGDTKAFYFIAQSINCRLPNQV